MENKDKLFDKLKRNDDCQETDISLLNESNLAGAFLDEKSASELRIHSLPYRQLMCLRLGSRSLITKILP